MPTRCGTPLVEVAGIASLASWTNNLKSSLPLIEIVAAPTFQARYGTLNDQQFVNRRNASAWSAKATPIAGWVDANGMAWLRPDHGPDHDDDWLN